METKKKKTSPPYPSLAQKCYENFPISANVHRKMITIANNKKRIHRNCQGILEALTPF